MIRQITPVSKVSFKIGKTSRLSAFPTMAFLTSGKNELAPHFID